MKFKSVHIQNFKLLRDISVDFSVETERPLTVIRAENGSGKTSMLSALQWGLFGEIGLEESARGIRLSPSDWPDGQRCEIQVEIAFTHTEFNEVGGASCSRSRPTSTSSGQLPRPRRETSSPGRRRRSSSSS